MNDGLSERKSIDIRAEKQEAGKAAPPSSGLSERKSIDIRAEKQGAGKAAPSSSGVPRPVWKLSPNPNGSTLYDSFELQAVTKQLNKAIQGSNGPLSPYSCYLKSSPLYRQGLDRIYKEGAKTPRRITSRRVVDTASVDAWCPRRLVIRLWKKIKRGLLLNK